MSAPHIERYGIVIIAGEVTGEYFVGGPGPLATFDEKIAEVKADLRTSAAALAFGSQESVAIVELFPNPGNPALADAFPYVGVEPTPHRSPSSTPRRTSAPEPAGPPATPSATYHPHPPNSAN
ncbi:hypothetical protein [Nocardia puris]|uniref:hypothetical protein n=1 Tax=Nocardia puris TaxID=208602 RepID=UPI0011BFD1F2|nr:hypothetical protein [Nocardia puris]